MNAGDSKVGRLKASITKRTRAGVTKTKATMTAPAAASPVPTVPTKVSETMQTPPTMPQTRPYKGTKKFLGSFKFGGPVHRTGVYLLHKGEHVKSPYKRPSKGLTK